MLHCHRKGTKTRDLLLGAHLNVKVADVGFRDEFFSGDELDTLCGRPPYMASQLFEDQKYNGPLAAVCSLGVILYVLLTESLSFTG